MESSTPRAIQLISIDSDGKCSLNPEAEEFISKIDRNISVICVAGLYRTGKSYLLNRLLNRQNGFEIGSTIKSCTKGIWVWNESLTLKNQEVLLMDTEGLGSAFEDRNQSIDMEIFVLSVLLSSYFIYNSMKIIDESSIEALSLVLNFAKKIQSEFSQVENYANNFPSFLWVIRDFALNLVDTEGKSITPKDYLEEALSYNNQNDTKDDEELQRKNEIRKLIKLFFKERDCKTIVRPVTDDKKLKIIDKLPEHDIRPEFMSQMRDLVKHVFKSLRPKSVQGGFLNGEMYLNLIKMYINALNMNLLPDVKTSWQIVVDSQVASLQEKAYNIYLDHMLDLDYKKIISLEELLKSSEEFKRLAYGELKALHSLQLPGLIVHNVISKLEVKINDTLSDLITKWKDTSLKQTIGLSDDIIKEFETNKKPLDMLSSLELFREVYKFIDDSIPNLNKYEIVYPKVTTYFIDQLKSLYLKERQTHEEEKQKVKTEKESLENLLSQTKQMLDKTKSEFDTEVNKFKQETQGLRLDMEARLDEKNKMIKTIQASNENIIDDLKENINDLHKQIELKNREMKYKTTSSGGGLIKSTIPDSIAEGIMMKLDTFKDNLHKAELDKVKLSIKQEIGYRIENLQEDFQKKLTVLRKECEKLVLQVKADSKREIDEYKQIIKVSL